MHFPMLRQSVIICIITASATGDQFCDRGTWGTPKYDDCQPLLNEFADATDHTERIFVEEQLNLDRNGAWQGLWKWASASDIYRAVQTPRIYSRRKCCARIHMKSAH